MLKTHGWDKESPDSSKPCSDGETEGHLVSPMPVDCLTWVCKEEGFKEGTVEHSVVEKKMGFQCQVALGELVCARPIIAHSVTTPSKFSSAPSEHHTVSHQRVSPSISK